MRDQPDVEEEALARTLLLLESAVEAEQLEAVDLDHDLAHPTTDRPRRRQRLDVLADVVDAEDGRAALEREHGDGDPGGDRARSSASGRREAAEEALA